MNTTPEFSLLFSTNCFNAPNIVGKYNPKIDAILLRPHAIKDADLRKAILPHEGKGHRAFALQGSFFRVQRLYAGMLYSYLAQLLAFLDDGGFILQGRTLDELHLSPERPSDDHYLYHVYFATPDKALNFLLGRIKHLHLIIDFITDYVRPVYELVATAWTVSDLRHNLPSEEVDQLETRLLELTLYELQGCINPGEFTDLYKRYSQIPDLGLQFRLALHTLDVCDWGCESHPDDPDFHTPVANFNADPLQRFRNLLILAHIYPHDTYEFLGQTRMRDVEHFTAWAKSVAFVGPLKDVEYDCQFPFRLMLLFDAVLYGPSSRSHICLDTPHDCMEALYRSLVFCIESPQGVKIQINDHLCSAALDEDHSAIIRGWCDRDQEADYGGNETNPLGITVEWYRWLVLFEALYASLIDTTRKGVGCPLAPAGMRCSKTCPIRRHLAGLAEHSELVTRPICPLQ